MKLKTILTMICAATMCGCGDVRNADTYYIYGNDTDRTITVECFTKVLAEGEETAYRKDTTLAIAPGKEFTLKLSEGHIAAPFEFTDYHYGQYLTYSNGEKTFRQEADAPDHKYRNPLFNQYTYDKIAESLQEVIYKFVFTEEDFEDYVYE